MQQTPREEFEELKAGLPQVAVESLEKSSDNLIKILQPHDRKDAAAAMAVLDYTRAKVAAAFNLSGKL